MFKVFTLLLFLTSTSLASQSDIAGKRDRNRNIPKDTIRSKKEVLDYVSELGGLQRRGHIEKLEEVELLRCYKGVHKFFITGKVKFGKYKGKRTREILTMWDQVKETQGGDWLPPNTPRISPYSGFFSSGWYNWKYPVTQPPAHDPRGILKRERDEINEKENRFVDSISATVNNLLNAIQAKQPLSADQIKPLRDAIQLYRREDTRPREELSPRLRDILEAYDDIKSYVAKPSQTVQTTPPTPVIQTQSTPGTEITTDKPSGKPATPANPKGKPKSSLGAGWIILIIFLILAVIGGAIAAYIYCGKTDDSYEVEEPDV